MATRTTSLTSRGSWEPLVLPANGQGFVRAAGDAFESRDPATGEVVATLRSSTPQDLDSALERAQQAFRESRWASAAVVKPASLTSAVTVEALALLAAQPDLPDGILECVLGSGVVVGYALVGHDSVEMIAFTGETLTGIQVMKRAAEGLRKVALELGGKAPNLVFADSNLEKALAGAENAIFTTCGQICTAGSRLLVEDPIFDEFIERLTANADALRIGDGL